MKNIVNSATMQTYKWDATSKWKEYVAAEKIHRKPEYTDLKKIYHEIKSGKKTIDIFKIIQAGGIHLNKHHPKLAIAQANKKIVYCRYKPDGTVHFVNRDNYWSNVTSHPIKCDVALEKCLPAYDRVNVIGNNYNDICISAPVPLIPPNLMPAKLTDNYYILWEVDVWEKAPPTDPYLLKRITNTVFSVLGAWDLTDVEKAVMRGRMV